MIISKSFVILLLAVSIAQAEVYQVVILNDSPALAESLSSQQVVGGKTVTIQKSASAAFSSMGLASEAIDSKKEKFKATVYQEMPNPKYSFWSFEPRTEQELKYLHEMSDKGSCIIICSYGIVDQYNVKKLKNERIVKVTVYNEYPKDFDIIVSTGK